jgi:hypothetical protein
MYLLLTTYETILGTIDIADELLSISSPPLEIAHRTSIAPTLRLPYTPPTGRSLPGHQNKD